MARLTDHDVRDAEHALRAEVAILVGRYSRRILEEGKRIIATELAEGGDHDATTIGRYAAQRAAFPYFGDYAGKPLTTLEGSAHRAELGA